MDEPTGVDRQNAQVNQEAENVENKEGRLSDQKVLQMVFLLGYFTERQVEEPSLIVIRNMIPASIYNAIKEFEEGQTIEILSQSLEVIGWSRGKKVTVKFRRMKGRLPDKSAAVYLYGRICGRMPKLREEESVGIKSEYGSFSESMPVRFKNHNHRYTVVEPTFEGIMTIVNKLR